MWGTYYEKSFIIISCNCFVYVLCLLHLPSIDQSISNMVPNIDKLLLLTPCYNSAHLKPSVATLVCYWSEWRHNKQEGQWGRWQIQSLCWSGPSTKTGRPWRNRWSRTPLGWWVGPEDKPGMTSRILHLFPHQRHNQDSVHATHVHMFLLNNPEYFFFLHQLHNVNRVAQKHIGQSHAELQLCTGVETLTLKGRGRSGFLYRR